MSLKNVAVAGATGAVGTEMINVLEDLDFPVKEIRYLASHRSKGKMLKFKGEDVVVEELTEDSFDGIDIALFSAGGDRSKQFAPAAVKSGAVVIDNSSAFRMDKDVPLIVPEVNPDAVKEHKGIIANPNCSTIQMVVALKPLYDYSKIKTLFVSTYQAVSGAGLKAIEDLRGQTEAIINNKELPEFLKFPHQIAFNCLPHIGSFLENGYTEEEMKAVNETHKIMGDYNIKVSSHCVRVPVFYSHAETVTIETENKISAAQAKELLNNFPGVIVQDDIEKNIYPLQINCAKKYEVFVGRIREDTAFDNGISMWVVSDNLLKGAAYNAVQIAQLLL